MFFHLYQESYIPFSSLQFSDLMTPGYPQKASYFEYRLCHNFCSGKDQTWIIEISCTDNNYFLCDRVCSQSQRYPGSVLIGKNVGWKMVYNFLGRDEKT